MFANLKNSTWISKYVYGFESVHEFKTSLKKNHGFERKKDKTDGEAKVLGDPHTQKIRQTVPIWFWACFSTLLEHRIIMKGQKVWVEFVIQMHPY